MERETIRNETYRGIVVWNSPGNATVADASTLERFGRRRSGFLSKYPSSGAWIRVPGNWSSSGSRGTVRPTRASLGEAAGLARADGCRVSLHPVRLRSLRRLWRERGGLISAERPRQRAVPPLFNAVEAGKGPVFEQDDRARRAARLWTARRAQGASRRKRHCRGDRASLDAAARAGGDARLSRRIWRRSGRTAPDRGDRAGRRSRGDPGGAQVEGGLPEDPGDRAGGPPDDRKAGTAHDGRDHLPAGGAAGRPSWAPVRGLLDGASAPKVRQLLRALGAASPWSQSSSPTGAALSGSWGSALTGRSGANWSPALKVAAAAAPKPVLSVVAPTGFEPVFQP